MKNSPGLSDRLTVLAIMRDPLKPFGSIVLWYSRGFKGPSIGTKWCNINLPDVRSELNPFMPRDAVSRTANVERTVRHKLVDIVPLASCEITLIYTKTFDRSSHLYMMKLLELRNKEWKCHVSALPLLQIPLRYLINAPDIWTLRKQAKCFMIYIRA